METKNRHFFIPIIMVLCISVVHAQQVSMDEARLAAKTCSRYYSDNVVHDRNTYIKSNTSHILLYEIEMDDGYSVLLSGNKSCLPVLARYKTRSCPLLLTDNDEIPGGLRVILSEYIPVAF